MKFNKKLFFIVALGLLIALPTQAQGLLPACAKDVKAVLQLSCFLNLLIGISQWILGITGSLALLFFVYGGFLFLTSRGSSDQVQKGKTILTQATIGIIIIFGAYLAINFLVTNVLKAKFTTEIPQEAAPAAPALKTQPVSCGVCNCFPAGGGSPIPIGSGYTSNNECLNACKKQGYQNANCGAIPTAKPTECNCYCKSGISNLPEGITATEQECKNKCLIKKTEGGFCGKY